MPPIHEKSLIRPENLKTHDELVLEVEASQADAVRSEVARLMDDAADLRVPLKVEAGIGANWDVAH